MPAVPWDFRDSTETSANGPPVNVAVTLTAALIVTVQDAVPLQPPPLQPAKVEPDNVAAVSVTLPPETNDATQLRPQSMPAGAEVTVPVPSLFTVNGPDCVASLV